MRTFAVTFVLSLVLIQCFSLSSDCGGNCLSYYCDNCQCGSSKSIFPGWDQKCCECVVKKGSKGNANAQNERGDGTYDVGLWQINSNQWNSCSAGTAPCSVQGNMECAIGMWKKAGGSFKAWDSCASCGCCKTSAPNGYKAADVSKTASKVPTTTIKTPKRKRVLEVENQKMNITAPENTCGGNCPSNDCGSCPCGTTTSPQGILPISAFKFTGWDQTCCQCIVQHESGGNANAANENSNGSFDVGLWQINSANWPSCNGGSAPCATNANLQCAQQIWKNGGNSFKQWSTCGGCGCCSPTTGGTTGNSNTGPATSGHSTNGPSSHSTTSPSSTSSTYSSVFFESQLPHGGNGNAPLSDVRNVIFHKKK